MSWAAALSDELLVALEDDNDPNTQALSSCGVKILQRLKRSAYECASQPESKTTLDTLIDLAYEGMSSSPMHSNPYCWRRLYTDACLFRSLADMQAAIADDGALALSAISRLDRTLVIAGAAGEGRADLVHAVIAKIQSVCLSAASDRFFDSSFSFGPSPASNLNIPSFAREVPCLQNPPSMVAFQRSYFGQPFVLKGYISEWPALNEHPWRSPAYLRQVAGPGRVIPVEVGKDYRASDWTQTILRWDDFLDVLASSPVDDRHSVLYLAQHNLLAQFPRLRDDIVIPDYIYADMPVPANYPDYHPPGNEERLILNAWLGPNGTISPAHTDPYYNLYAQVVGRKTVWLAPPHVTPSMYPYAPSSAPESLSSWGSTHNPAANNTDPSLSNTSRVDVFSSEEAQSRADFPLFFEKVVPEAMAVTLEPGDLLFFPPGWWHAMRAEDVSFSVSMWF